MRGEKYPADQYNIIILYNNIQGNFTLPTVFLKRKLVLLAGEIAYEDISVNTDIAQHCGSM